MKETLNVQDFNCMSEEEGEDELFVKIGSDDDIVIAFWEGKSVKVTLGNDTYLARIVLTKL